MFYVLRREGKRWRRRRRRQQYEDRWTKGQRFSLVTALISETFPCYTINWGCRAIVAKSVFLPSLRKSGTNSWPQKDRRLSWPAWKRTENVDSRCTWQAAPLPVAVSRTTVKYSASTYLTCGLAWLSFSEERTYFYTYFPCPLPVEQER